MKILTAHFTTNGYPQSGLTPTITIYQIGSGGSSTVVDHDPVMELGTGWYFYRFVAYDPTQNYVFTFDGGTVMSAYERFKVGGNESYAEEISDQVWEETAVDHTTAGTTGMAVNQIKANTSTMLINEATMATLLTTLLKFERNRTRIDMQAAQLVIYDDDCETPIATFDLRDFHGMPSVTEVCERIPTTCGATQVP